MKRTSSTITRDDESLTATRCQSAVTNNGTAGRDRNNVDRWVAMINAELDADDDVGQDMVDVTIEFGRTNIDTATQRIEPGALIRLDQLAAEPVDLVVSGLSVARGELVTVEGKIGVRIVEVFALLLLAFFIGFDTTVAEERTRESSLRRTLQVETEESDTESFSPKNSLRKSTDSSRSAKPTKKIVPLESPETPLPNERLINGSRSEPIAITPPSTSRLSNSNAEGLVKAERNSQNVAGWGSTAWPLLAIVVAIVFGTHWLRKHSPTAVRGLPSEAFDILGRRAIDQRNSVLIARCGSRVLVLSLSPHGMQTLVEITDPVEVDCLAGLCRMSQRDHSLADTFRAMLNKPASTKPQGATTADSIGAVSTSSCPPLESRWPDRLKNEGLASPAREDRG